MLQYDFNLFYLLDFLLTFIRFKDPVADVQICTRLGRLGLFELTRVGFGFVIIRTLLMSLSWILIFLVGFWAYNGHL